MNNYSKFTLDKHSWPWKTPCSVVIVRNSADIIEIFDMKWSTESGAGLFAYENSLSYFAKYQFILSTQNLYFFKIRLIAVFFFFIILRYCRATMVVCSLIRSPTDLQFTSRNTKFKDTAKGRVPGVDQSFAIQLPSG